MGIVVVRVVHTWFWREATKTRAVFPSESFLSPRSLWVRHSFVVTKTEIHQRTHVMESNYWSVGIKSQYVKHTLHFPTLSCFLSLTPRGIMIFSTAKTERLFMGNAVKAILQTESY